MNHLSTQPFLEVLRPAPGWRTDRAILSTYSAEPTVLVAVLLALAGRDDDAGGGSRVALARALTDLRGRVSFLLQRGRISTPHKAPGVLVLLDRFIREVPWDEGDTPGGPGRSWHAKLALIRFVAQDDADMPPQWRLWLGSRNFTRDTSWDIGLSLETVPPGTSNGQALPGIERVAGRLSEQAGETVAWQPLTSELTESQWDVPRGLMARRVALMLPDDPDRSLPEPPTDVSQLLAVAPFLDSGTVRQLGSWTDQSRTLLSTIPEMGRLIGQSTRPLDGFELLTLPGASEDGKAPPEEDAASLDASLDTRGLHAKFIWAEHAGGATLWLGSPNLTTRAWRRNAEAFVEVGVQLRGSAQAAKVLYEGIEAFRQIARLVRPEDLEHAASEDSDQEALEIARRQVAARLCGRQRRNEGGKTVIECDDRAPHPDDPAISLAIGRLGGALILWPKDTIGLSLPDADLGADTDLVSLRVSLKDEALSWTQLVPFDPPHPAGRDTSLLREYLGARGVLSWIRDVLEDTIETDGGGAWDAETESRDQVQAQRGLIDVDLPTIEQVLRAWVRDPRRLDSVDRILSAVATSPFKTEDDAKARTHLDAFSRSWKILCAGLIGGPIRVR